IAISTVISAINSLTLSPALAAVLLKPHGAQPDLPTRVLDRLLGWLFRPFNRMFHTASESYSRNVQRVLRRSVRMFALYGGLLVLTWGAFSAVPGGFIPTQDKLYLIGVLKTPEGSSLDRTEALARKMSDIAMH